MKYVKQQIILPNGETYYYIKQGSGPNTLVLVHGNMSSSIHYHPLLKRLPKDITVYSLDLRGFGDSSYHKPIDSLKDLAHDIKQFVDVLNIPIATFVGWSTGGVIVLQLASLYPEIVQKLVLIESSSHKGYPIFKKDQTGKMIFGASYESKKEMAEDPIQVAPVVKALEEKNAVFMSWLWDFSIYSINKPNPEENNIYIQETLKQRNLVDIDWGLATINMGSTPNFYGPGDNSIANIEAEVLHIWSTKDMVVPRYMLDENVEALKKQSKVIIYENSGHSPLIDNPEQLVNDILKFIK